MKQLDKDFLIYLAGFIDADGSIIAQLVLNREYKFGYQVRCTLQITQLKKRRWFLEKIAEELGVGGVRDRENVSDYVLVQIQPLYNLLKQLQPYLKLKQKQSNLLIKIIEQLPLAKDSQDKFLEVCDLVDQTAALNDSKTRKHTAATVRVALKGLSEEK